MVVVEEGVAAVGVSMVTAGLAPLLPHPAIAIADARAHASATARPACTKAAGDRIDADVGWVERGRAAKSNVMW